METLKTITLSEAGFAGLTILADKLNRRAERHGMDKLVVTVLREFTDGADYYRVVEIAGCAPRINGWRLAARIEFNDLVGCIVRIVPGVDDDGSFSTYREHDGGCDHCNTRRRRNDVFVLEDESGCRKVVGRNCLADFLRCTDAAGFAEYAELCERISSATDDGLAEDAYCEGFGSGGGRPVCALDRYLTVVSMVTRRIGWVSKTESRESFGKPSTADNASFYLWGRGRDRQRWIDANGLEVCDADAELATKAIEWAKSLESAQSEYLHTIHKIAKAGAVDWRLDGFAASIIRAYQRDCERQEERTKVAVEKDYIGSEGERLRDLTVRVVRVRYYESNFGVKTIVAMEASLPDGRVAPIVWFASGEKDYTEGSEYKMTATVKSHTDDKYGKQTTVTRAKLT